MQKNGSKTTRSQCGLLIGRYNGFGDGRLTREELWAIFAPKKLEKVESIAAVRRKKNVMPENMEIGYRAKELIVSLIEKTV